MRITLIAAVGTGGVIGVEGGLPWRLPADLAHFKRTTWGHSIILGRKTFDSIGRPLPGRRNIVFTSRPEQLPEGVVGVTDVESALARSAETSPDIQSDEVFVIGGAEVYRLFLPIADRLIITEVEGEFSGDVFFPEIEKSRFREVSREQHRSDPRNRHSYSFVIWEAVRDHA